MAPTGVSGRPGRLRQARTHQSQDNNNTSDEGTMATPYRTQSKPMRDPPPSLFLHPSPAASHVSLPSIMGPSSSASYPASLRRERSNLDPSAASIQPGSTQAPRRGLKTAESTRTTDRTDALWAEMQATLEEVELSASGGTHVFGPEHDRKLGDLRAAQIGLAQAWARSEADDAIETAHLESVASAVGDELRNITGAMADASKAGAGEATDEAKSTAPSYSAKQEGASAAGVERLGAKLEEETETDILLARKRREANDEYFRRVGNGVIDVVAKLDEVAKAMRAVEQDSKDVWDGDEALSESAKM